MKSRFDGYLPIVIDIETAGVDPLQNPLLEIAAVTIEIFNETFIIGEKFMTHILPFEGSRLDEEALLINKIDPYHPFRFAVKEDKAISDLFDFTKHHITQTKCKRAVLTGHNAHFDLSFINAAVKRCKIKNNPYHHFTCIDTATLSGVFYGKTILAKALRQAGLSFNKDKAHSAVYDAERTADLFCKILNSAKELNQ